MSYKEWTQGTWLDFSSLNPKNYVNGVYRDPGYTAQSAAFEILTNPARYLGTQIGNALFGGIGQKPAEQASSSTSDYYTLTPPAIPLPSLPSAPAAPGVSLPSLPALPSIPVPDGSYAQRHSWQEQYLLDPTNSKAFASPLDIIAAAFDKAEDPARRDKMYQEYTKKMHGTLQNAIKSAMQGDWTSSQKFWSMFLTNQMTSLGVTLDWASQFGKTAIYDITRNFSYKNGNLFFDESHYGGLNEILDSNQSWINKRLLAIKYAAGFGYEGRIHMDPNFRVGKTIFDTNNKGQSLIIPTVLKICTGDWDQIGDMWKNTTGLDIKNGDYSADWGTIFGTLIDTLGNLLIETVGDPTNLINWISGGLQSAVGSAAEGAAKNAINIAGAADESINLIKEAANDQIKLINDKIKPSIDQINATKEAISPIEKVSGPVTSAEAKALAISLENGSEALFKEADNPVSIAVQKAASDIIETRPGMFMRKVIRDDVDSLLDDIVKRAQDYMAAMRTRLGDAFKNDAIFTFDFIRQNPDIIKNSIKDLPQSIVKGTGLRLLARMASGTSSVANVFNNIDLVARFAGSPVIFAGKRIFRLAKGGLVSAAKKIANLVPAYSIKSEADIKAGGAILWDAAKQQYGRLANKQIKAIGVDPVTGEEIPLKEITIPVLNNPRVGEMRSMTLQTLRGVYEAIDEQAKSWALVDGSLTKAKLEKIILEAKGNALRELSIQIVNVSQFLHNFLELAGTQKYNVSILNQLVSNLRTMCPNLSKEANAAEVICEYTNECEKLLNDIKGDVEQGKTNYASYKTLESTILCLRLISSKPGDDGNWVPDLKKYNKFIKDAQYENLLKEFDNVTLAKSSAEHAANDAFGRDMFKALRKESAWAQPKGVGKNKYGYEKLDFFNAEEEADRLINKADNSPRHRVPRNATFFSAKDEYDEYYIELYTYLRSGGVGFDGRNMHSTLTKKMLLSPDGRRLESIAQRALKKYNSLGITYKSGEYFINGKQIVHEIVIHNIINDVLFNDSRIKEKWSVASVVNQLNALSAKLNSIWTEHPEINFPESYRQDVLKYISSISSMCDDYIWQLENNLSLNAVDFHEMLADISNELKYLQRKYLDPVSDSWTRTIKENKEMFDWFKKYTDNDRIGVANKLKKILVDSNALSPDLFRDGTKTYYDSLGAYGQIKEILDADLLSDEFDSGIEEFTIYDGSLKVSITPIELMDNNNRAKQYKELIISSTDDKNSSSDNFVYHLDTMFSDREIAEDFKNKLKSYLDENTRSVSASSRKSGKQTRTYDKILGSGISDEEKLIELTKLVPDKSYLPNKSTISHYNKLYKDLRGSLSKKYSKKDIINILAGKKDLIKPGDEEQFILLEKYELIQKNPDLIMFFDRKTNNFFSAEDAVNLYYNLTPHSYYYRLNAFYNSMRIKEEAANNLTDYNESVVKYRAEQSVNILLDLYSEIGDKVAALSDPLSDISKTLDEILNYAKIRGLDGEIEPLINLIRGTSAETRIWREYISTLRDEFADKPQIAEAIIQTLSGTGKTMAAQLNSKDFKYAMLRKIKQNYGTRFFTTSYSLDNYFRARFDTAEGHAHVKDILKKYVIIKDINLFSLGENTELLDNLVESIFTQGHANPFIDVLTTICVLDDLDPELLKKTINKASLLRVNNPNDPGQVCFIDYETAHGKNYNSYAQGAEGSTNIYTAEVTQLSYVVASINAENEIVLTPYIFRQKGENYDVDNGTLIKQGNTVIECDSQEEITRRFEAQCNKDNLVNVFTYNGDEFDLRLASRRHIADNGDTVPVPAFYGSYRPYTSVDVLRLVKERNGIPVLRPDEDYDRIITSIRKLYEVMQTVYAGILTDDKLDNRPIQSLSFGQIAMNLSEIVRILRADNVYTGSRANRKNSLDDYDEVGEEGILSDGSVDLDSTTSGMKQKWIMALDALRTNIKEDSAVLNSRMKTSGYDQSGFYIRDIFRDAATKDNPMDFLFEDKELVAGIEDLWRDAFGKDVQIDSADKFTECINSLLGYENISNLQQLLNAAYSSRQNSYVRIWDPEVYNRLFDLNKISANPQHGRTMKNFIRRFDACLQNKLHQRLSVADGEQIKEICIELCDNIIKSNDPIFAPVVAALKPLDESLMTYEEYAAMYVALANSFVRDSTVKFNPDLFDFEDKYMDKSLAKKSAMVTISKYFDLDDDLQYHGLNTYSSYSSLNLTSNTEYVFTNMDAFLELFDREDSSFMDPFDYSSSRAAATNPFYVIGNDVYNASADAMAVANRADAFMRNIQSALGDDAERFYSLSNYNNLSHFVNRLMEIRKLDELYGTDTYKRLTGLLLQPFIARENAFSMQFLAKCMDQPDFLTSFILFNGGTLNLKAKPGTPQHEIISTLFNNETYLKSLGERGVVVRARLADPNTVSLFMDRKYFVGAQFNNGRYVLKVADPDIPGKEYSYTKDDCAMDPIAFERPTDEEFALLNEKYAATHDGVVFINDELRQEFSGLYNDLRAMFYNTLRNNPDYLGFGTPYSFSSFDKNYEAEYEGDEAFVSGNNRAISKDDYHDAKFFSQHPTHINTIGSLDARNWSYGAADPISGLISTYKHTLTSMSAREGYLTMMFNDNYSLNFGKINPETGRVRSGLFAGADDDTIYKWYTEQNTNHLIALQLVPDGSLNGFHVEEYKINSVDDIRAARRFNEEGLARVALVPYSVFSQMFDSINTSATNYRMPAKGTVQFDDLAQAASTEQFVIKNRPVAYWIRKVLQYTKASLLFGLAPTTRNLIDSNLKANIATGDPVGMFKNSIRSIKLYRNEAEVQKLMAKFQYELETASDEDLMKMLGVVKDAENKYSFIDEDGYAAKRYAAYCKSRVSTELINRASTEAATKVLNAHSYITYLLRIWRGKKFGGSVKDARDFFDMYTAAGRPLPMTFQEFMLVENFMRNGPSSGMSSAYEKRIREDVDEATGKAKRKARKQMGFGERLDYDVSKFTEAGLLGMGFVERNVRFAQYLTDIGRNKLSDEAYYNVSKTAFDYSIKSNADKLIEYVIPFWTFTKLNLEYWSDAFEDHPELFKTVVNLYQSYAETLEGENGESIYDLMERNMSMLYAFNNGTYVLNRNSGFGVKLNPSYTSFFNWAINPLGAAKDAMWPVLGNSVEGLVGLAGSYLYGSNDEAKQGVKNTSQLLTGLSENIPGLASSLMQRYFVPDSTVRRNAQRLSTQGGNTAELILTTILPGLFTSVKRYNTYKKTLRYTSYKSSPYSYQNRKQVYVRTYNYYYPHQRILRASENEFKRKMYNIDLYRSYGRVYAY